MGVQRVLCGSGGGFFGSFTMGLLNQWLEGGKIPLADFCQALVGCSTDAINFAAVAHSGLEKTTAMWNNLKSTSDIYATKDPSGIPLNELADMAFGKWCGQKNSAPLWNLIKQYVVGLPVVDVTVCAVDFDSGEIHYATHHKDGSVTVDIEDGMGKVMTGLYPSTVNEPKSLLLFQQYVLASASTPELVDSVSIEGGDFLDGGTRQLLPAAYAKLKRDMLYYARPQVIDRVELWAVSLSNYKNLGKWTQEKNAIGTAEQAINIMLFQQLVDSVNLLKEAATVNTPVFIYLKPELGGSADEFDPKVNAAYFIAGEKAVPDWDSQLV